MKLFIDLDGTVADFDAHYGAIFGARPSKADDNVDWALVAARSGFYRDMPPMEDFDELWRGVAHLQPTILTGIPASVPDAGPDKRAWVDLHLGRHVPMIACRSADKALHAAPGDIIIDDWEKYRHLWERMGGIWITHINAATSLARLERAMNGEAV